MASLYIKDPEVAELAAKVAALQGKSKTQAVKDALRSVVDRISPDAEEPSTEGSRERELLAWLEDLHRKHPAPRKAEHDRRIYDWMSDEEDE